MTQQGPFIHQRDKMDCVATAIYNYQLWKGDSVAVAELEYEKHYKDTGFPYLDLEELFQTKGFKKIIQPSFDEISNRLRETPLFFRRLFIAKNKEYVQPHICFLFGIKKQSILHANGDARTCGEIDFESFKKDWMFQASKENYGSTPTIWIPMNKTEIMNNWAAHLSKCPHCKRAVRLRFTDTNESIFKACCDIGKPLYKLFIEENKKRAEDDPK